MSLHSALASFLISFIFLPFSTFTFFKVVSYLTHCQPSIFPCFQAISKTQYLTAALLPYPVFVHTFFFLNFFHDLCCPKLTIGRLPCLEPCLVFLFFIFSKAWKSKPIIQPSGCLRVFVEAFCYSQRLPERSCCVNKGRGKVNWCTFLQVEYSFIRLASDLYFPLLHCFPTSISGWANWQQLPCGLTKIFTQAIKEMLFAPSTRLSVFYNHVRESKIASFSSSFLLPILSIFATQLR